MSAGRPVVLGGGAAGIAAAVTLARAGRRPILLEARPYLGGRMRSFVHERSGEEIDNGQHLMMGCYRATLGLLDILGTRHLVHVQDRLDVAFRDADGSPDRLVSSDGLPAPLNVVAGMLRLRGLSRAERLGLLRVAWLVRRGARDGETVDGLLARARQSRRARQRLWDPIVLATLNATPAAAPASTFVEVMRRAFLGGALDSRLAVPRAPLSHLIAPAADLIASHGGNVLTGRTVESIIRNERGFVVTDRSGESHQASALVCALPPTAATRLLAPVGLDLPHWKSSPGSPIVSVYLWYDTQLDAVPELVALLGTAVQWVFNRRRMLDRPGQPGLLACTISAAAQAGDASEEIVALADRELRRALPEIPRSARLVDAIVIKERHATFLTDASQEPHRPRTATFLPGLALAGDWTATGLPATIEGAIASGIAAGRDVGDVGTWGRRDVGTWGRGDVGTWGRGDVGT